MQSPARARYSPLAIKAAFPEAVCCCASAVMALASSHPQANAQVRIGNRYLGARGMGRFPQFGSPPQASGIGRLPCGANDGSDGAGRDDSQAATAFTSSSVNEPATICMQSGAV